MTIDFDSLPDPEPSSVVGFSANPLTSDSEHRTEESLPQALEHPCARFHILAGARVVLWKGEPPKSSFSRDEAERFAPKMERALLLGNKGGIPRLAVPAGIDVDALEEPWAAYDMRSLLYSSKVLDEDAGAIAQASSLMHWHRMNRYCGKCGTPSEMRIGGYRRDCPECGSTLFPRTDPVVIMLAVRGNQCLMGRSPHFPPGWFSTLAGFVEPGETIEAAVRRETFEESGISVGRVRYHASQPWPFPHSLMIGAHCEALTEKIKRDESELEDCRWFSREEVKLMLKSEHPDGFMCPPNKAISSALILHWANSKD